MSQNGRSGANQDANPGASGDEVLRIRNMNNANFMVRQMIQTDSDDPVNFQQQGPLPDPPRLPKKVVIDSAQGSNLFVGRMIIHNSNNPAPPPQHHPPHSSHRSSQQHWPGHARSHPSYQQGPSRHAPQFQQYSEPVQERTSTEVHHYSHRGNYGGNGDGRPYRVHVERWHRDSTPLSNPESDADP